MGSLVQSLLLRLVDLLSVVLGLVAWHHPAAVVVEHHVRWTGVG